MPFTIVRAFFVLLCALMGFQIGDILNIGDFSPYIGVAIGILLGFLIIALELSSKRISIKGLSAAVFGVVFGILFAWLIIGVFKFMMPMDDARGVINGLLIVVFAYLGMV